ncbi:damage-control phosphatase ARMT1-like isoform X2 [Clavelina lepadiformis]|uniref:damage-control phosphatase ARMT1-like isoform X2 n=1 Tax=Clavelina lepadiformis TaxID=159417 RepID=UPI004042880F
METNPSPLSAKHESSFAYGTVKDRMPRILTKVIDVCHKQIQSSKECFGEDGRKDAIDVVGKLSQLRSEIMTDKPLFALDDQLKDKEAWNKRLQQYSNDSPASWFTAPWLYVECFMYRRIAGVLNSSTYLKTFDPFAEQKQQSLMQSMTAVENLATFLHSVKQSVKVNDTAMLKQFFVDFLQVSLWGNKCDLSISAGEENSQNVSEPHKNLEALKKFILIDYSNDVWNLILKQKKRKDQVRIDVVLDNAGFELFTDLVLCEFLLFFNLADVIIIHPKCIPWFVSDVNASDLNWMLSYLSSCSFEEVSQLSTKLQERFKDGSMLLMKNDFWTLPDPFCLMNESSSELYKYFSSSDLVLFKGDLNYRKLVGDLDWPHDTSFKMALRHFSPTSLCSLRTLKADVVVGLKPGQAKLLAKECKEWMVNGQYAVIESNIIC